MAASNSNGPPTLQKKWKWLVGSVLAAALIGLLCGLCESPTKQACMTISTGIASSLSRTVKDMGLIPNKSKTDSMSLGTTLSIKATSKNSLNGSENISNKKSATFIAENTETKHSDRTIMRVCSTVHSTIKLSNNQATESQRTQARHLQIYGAMGSAPSANSISIQPLTRRGIYLKRLTGNKPWTSTYAQINMAWRIGLGPLTLRCL